jgi:hypothetical protein
MQSLFYLFVRTLSLKQVKTCLRSAGFEVDRRGFRGICLDMFILPRCRLSPDNYGAWHLVRGGGHLRRMTAPENMSVHIIRKTHFVMRCRVDCSTRTDIDAARPAVFRATHKALGQATDVAAPIVRKFYQQPGVLPPYNVLSH